MTHQLVSFRRDDGGGERLFALPGHLPSPGDRVRIGVDMDLFEVTGIEHAILPDPVEGGIHECIQATCVRIMPVSEGQPPSPALERYRTARAGLAELDLEQRRGELVDRQDGQQDGGAA